MHPSKREDLIEGMGSIGFGWLLMGCAGIIRTLLAVHVLPNGLFDDAYITFRYASNLVRGFGFVFNPGERVLGTTSPLFTFILAEGARIRGPKYIEEIAISCGIFASLGMLYFCNRALNTVAVPQGVRWAFLAVLSFLPSFLSNSISGMETPIVLFLMSLSLYFCVENRLLALSVVGVLLFLTRVDTGIWLLAMGIHILLSRKGKSFHELLSPLVLFAAAAGAWLCFAKIYFGSVVPQSVVGKAVSHGVFVLPDWNYTLTFLSAFVPGRHFGAWGLVLIVVVLLLLLPSTVDLYQRYPQLRPIVFFFPLYAIIFLASHAPLFSWYLMPPKWAFYFIVVYALQRYASRAITYFHLPLRPAQVMAVVGALLFLGALVEVKRQADLRNPYPGLAICNYLERSLRPGSSIFLEHIGLIGYKTDRYIYDYMGLVTPRTTRLRKMYGSGWLPKAAREYNADIVILYDSDLPVIQSRQDDDAIWFQQNYSHVSDYPLPELTVSMFLKKDSHENISNRKVE